MKILLEELPHQEEALNAIIKNFPELDLSSQNNATNQSNPLLKNRYDEKSFIDVKMETGTGKTYVYTRLLYELHKKYGLFKFIIVVPTPSIKEGTKNFIQSEYAKQHFSQFYGNTRIELNMINAGDFAPKNNRKNLPPALLNFVESSNQNNNSIQVLLINSGMLNSSNMNKNDFDQSLLGGVTSPIKALDETNPIVIMDEPHRFPRNGKSYKSITKLNPQLIIRFGATFPLVEKRQNNKKVIKHDYYQGVPQYNLNAVNSFNNGLVKGIDIYYPDLSENEAQNIYTVKNLSAREVTFKQNNKERTLKIGDSLNQVDTAFQGNVTYEGSKYLSNYLTLEKNMKLIPGTFKTSYQELIIKNAVNKHFDIEQENFLKENLDVGNTPKIKTLSLFFIDDIKSYQNNGWLKLKFEEILLKKLNLLIKEYEQLESIREQEYLSFLRSTKNSLISDTQEVHAGYFHGDRTSKDEVIQKQVQDILQNKEKLLTFKDSNGDWILRRFLFSKWTLREGWDNPNVFVIAKLRTSGSDNSKLQEVGRGLRLPVDEYGHRVKHDEWESRLAFLIGYDEKEFAKKIKNEIEEDVEIKINKEQLTEQMISLIVKEKNRKNKNYDSDMLLTELDKLNIINRSNYFNENVTIDSRTQSGYHWLIELYPEILNNVQLNPQHIVDTKNESPNLKLKLRKNNWSKLQEVWQEFSKRYVLNFERNPNLIQDISKKVLRNNDNYVFMRNQEVKESMVNKNEEGSIDFKTYTSYSPNEINDGIPYGSFVIQINKNTNLPINLIHENLHYMLKNDLNGKQEYFNENTLSNIYNQTKSYFEDSYSQLYKYERLKFSANTALYDSKKNQFAEYINSNLVGILSDEHIIDNAKNLYELPPLRYDSVDPEKDILTYKFNDNVIAFGKLPKNSIKVPKYTGGSTTPDFIFIIKQKDSSLVYLVVETKTEVNKRVDDITTIEIQKAFFNKINDKNIYYSEASSVDQIVNIIENLTLDED